MAILRVLALLGVLVAAASAASIGSQTTCCGPAEWEALAVASAAYGYEKSQSSGMSGRLSVSHSGNMATLLLVSEMMGMNNTMTMVVNDSKIYVYFVLQHRNQHQQPDPQPTCAAYLLENVIADISSSCFPSDKSSPVDRLSTLFGSMPVNLIAYEYGGLAGLLALQMFASGQDCSPLMFSMSTPDVSAGPQLSVLLSNVQSGVSDRSVLNQPPTACLGVNPLTINMANMGRRDRHSSGPSFGGMGPSRGSGSSRGGSQWIEDMVAMYVLLQMHSDSRNRRDLKDVLGLDDKHDSSPSLPQVVESAAALRMMLQSLSDFIGRNDNSDSRRPGFFDDGSRSDDGRDSSRGRGSSNDDSRDRLFGLLGGGSRDDDSRNGRDDSRDGSRGRGSSNDDRILGLLGDGSRGGDSRDGRGPRNSFDQSDVDALVRFLVQRNLISGLGSDHGDNSRRSFDQSDVEALAALLIQRNLMQSIGDHGDRRDSSDRRDQSSNADQLSQLVETMQKIQAAKNVMQLIERAALYETKNSQDDHKGPDLSSLLRLAAVAASSDQSRGSDYSSLIALLSRQQQHH